MSGKIKLLFLVIVLGIASGCAGKPVLTVEVYATPTQSPMVSDFTDATPGMQAVLPASPTPAAQDITVPVFTQARADLPSDFSPILYGKKYDANTFFLLLGGVQAGKWLTPEQAASLIKGTSEYDIYTSAGQSFPILGYAPESAPIHPGQYFIGSDAAVDEFGMVGAAHGWTIRQVQPEELSGDNDLYQQIVRDWLKKAGLSEPQQGILHIFRIDLEDDGVDEIFISASHLDDSQHTTRNGDYSIILMRKVAGNEAVTTPLIADIYRSKEAETTYPRTYTLANFMDLNQDGILEVVVDYHRWEEDGALIYTIQGQQITQVP